MISNKPARASYRSSYLLILSALLLVLNACAPASTGLTPSGSANQQLTTLYKQQQQQSEQLQQLQTELTQLKQQLAGGEITPGQIGHQLDQPLPEIIPQSSVPAEGADSSRDAQAVAASATSYLAAFSSLAAGRWQEAESGFRTFLERYRDHQYAPNARYWLASAQLSQGNSGAAAQNLMAIINDPRGQGKAPAALLRLEQLYRSRGENSRADELATRLRNQYPDSAEASVSERRRVQQN